MLDTKHMPRSVDIGYAPTFYNKKLYYETNRKR